MGLNAKPDLLFPSTPISYLLKNSRQKFEEEVKYSLCATDNSKRMTRKIRSCCQEAELQHSRALCQGCSYLIR